MKLIHGRYEIIAIIGQGGSGEVFHVKDHRLHSDFAMKRMKRQLNSKAYAAFMQEIDIAAQLHHPHIPRVIDQFEENDECFVVMDLITGIPLIQYVRDHVVIQQQVLVEWMEQIVDIFLYLHAHSILYLDLKPQNIMITKSNKLYLVDFGSSCIETQIRIHSATPGYAPPEVLKQHTAKRQSDIYSFGITFYVLFHGHFPQQQKKQNRVDKMLAHCYAQDIEDRYVDFHAVKKALITLKSSTVHHVFRMMVSFLLCIIFIGLSVITIQRWNTYVMDQYHQAMDEQNYEEAVHWNPIMIEPYLRISQTSCDDMDIKCSKKTFWRIEKLSQRHRYEELNILLGVQAMMIHETAYYKLALSYFEDALNEHEDNYLIQQLYSLANLLSMKELNKGEYVKIKDVLKICEKACVQQKDIKLRFMYLKMLLILYEDLHGMLTNSYQNILSLCDTLESLLSQYPDSFSRKEKTFLLNKGALAYYFKGLDALKLQNYAEMSEAYEKSLQMMKSTTMEGRYVFMSDMEFTRFEYGIRDEEKGHHIVMLKQAQFYATKISNDDERHYYLERISEAIAQWGG